VFAVEEKSSNSGWPLNWIGGISLLSESPSVDLSAFSIERLQLAVELSEEAFYICFN
jgi:hypothetical protein